MSVLSESPSRRLRVLCLIESVGGPGGAERFAAGLVGHLPRDRYEPWICTTRDFERSDVASLVAGGVKHVHLGRRTKWDVHKLGALVALLRRERYDILHAHMFGSNVWGTLAGRMCRVPVVIAQEQTWSYEGNRLRVLLDRWVIGRLATRFVAVSSADAARMVSVERVPENKIVVIPNAYVPRPVSHSGDIRAELGLPPDTPLLGIAAVFRPQKALHVLIDAYARLLQDVPTAHLVIAGRGPCDTELRRHVGDVGVTAGVHFLGARDDVDAILQSVDVAALSSDFEGTPLFALECLANRTPLVATRVGGLPDIIDDGRTGVLVPPRDPEALAAALAGLLLDPARRAEIAEAGVAALQDFTIERITQRFTQLYEQLMEEARGHAVPA